MAFTMQVTVPNLAAVGVLNFNTRKGKKENHSLIWTE